MPQMQNNQPNTFVQWVQGINAAKSFPVAPNTSIPLFDSEANVIYIKSADASGESAQITRKAVSHTDA